MNVKGFKYPPTILLDVFQKEWKYLKFNIEKFDNGCYDVYYDMMYDNLTRNYIIISQSYMNGVSNELKSFDYITCFLNMRHNSITVSAICREIAINKNEIIYE
jgi:hypothetical protein